MIRFLENKLSLISRTSLAVLLMSVCLITLNCTPPADDGNDNQNVNDNTNGNDNGNANNGNDNGITGGPNPGQIFVEFDFSTQSNDIARALQGDGTEYGFFGVKDASATSFELTQIDVILPTRVAVRSTLDDLGRPSQLLAEDDSAMLLDYDDTAGEVTATFVAVDGEASQTTVMLDSSSARQARQVMFGVDAICSALDDFSSVVDGILETCRNDPDSKLCTGSIAQAGDALALFCASDLIEVINTLGSAVGSGPALAIPLGVVVTTPVDSITPETGISLQAGVFGGLPPYRFNWEVLESSPATPEIISSDAGSISTGTVNLVATGLYTLRTTVFDSVGDVTFFDVAILVSAEPGALMVEADAEISEADPFVATLSARASGGIPPFTFVWSQKGGPEGSAVTFENEAAATTIADFPACGTYIVEVRATDAQGISTPFSFPIEIVDPSADLIVAIVPPACSQSQLDACVALGGSISLDVDVSGVSGSGSFLYEWELVDGASSGVLTDETTAAPTLTAIGPDTLAVRVTVTDEDTCQTATDQISVEVILEGQLTVVILSDGSATLNQPEMLLANVSGAIGELSYQWDVVVVVDEGSGTFDDATAQNVEFTPTSGSTVTVQVMVTDSARDTCSTDEQCADKVGESCNEDNKCAAIATETINIATFSVDIDGDSPITRNTVASYTAPLSGDAPAGVTYLWSVEKQDPDDASFQISLVDEAAATLQLLPQGDGLFDLSVLVVQADDPDNFASGSMVISVECSDPDIPGADAGAAQLASPSAPDPQIVTLVCQDPVQSADRSFRWRQIGGQQVTLVDPNTAGAKFTMPNQTPADFDPLQFECFVQNDATQCEQSDTTTVFATPLTAPVDESAAVTSLVGDQVQLTCALLSGATVDEYDWRQVDADGVEVDPADQVADFSVDALAGVLTFTAPRDAGQLFFECRGTINDADGDLAGPFSTDEPAVVTVENFDVAVVVRDSDPAAGGSLDVIDVDRIRLTNTSPGNIVFATSLSGASADSGVFFSDLTGGSLALVLEGDAAPNGGTIGQISAFDIDDSANLAFVAAIAGGPVGGETQGVFGTAGGSLAEVAANGATDENPAGQRFCGFDDVALAGTGAVSFIALSDADPPDADLDCDGVIQQGLYSNESGTTSAIAEADKTIIPDSIPGVVFGNFLGQLLSNAGGDVIFVGRDDVPTAVGAFMRPAGGVLDSIFLNNRVAADTNEVYTATLPADVAMNKFGVAAFQAGLIGQGGDPTQGIFTNVGSLGTRVVLNGSGSPQGGPILSNFEQVAINAAGDVAFVADGQLFFYAKVTGAVVPVSTRDDPAVPIANGEIVAGVTINAVDGLADVQLNDAGDLVFAAKVNGSGTAVFVAQPPN